VIVEVKTDRSTALLEPEDTRSFKLVAPRDLNEADLADALSGIADVASTDYAWVLQSWVRENSGLAASVEWQNSFDKMLDFARSKNWLRPTDEAIRAHIERR
jgi:hypothetical protein